MLSKKKILFLIFAITIIPWNLCKADSEANQLLLLEAEASFDINVLAAYDLTKSILDEFRRQNDTINLAKAYQLLGMSHYVMNNPDKSHIYYDSSRVEYSKLNDTAKVYELLIISAKVAREASEYEAAKMYLDILFNDGKPQNFKAYISAATTEYAMIQESMNELELAETGFKSALDYNLANDFKNNYADNLLDLARVYRKQLKNEAVFEILRQAESEFKRLSDDEGLATTYLMWGEVAYDIGDLTSSKDKLQKSAVISEQINNLSLLKNVFYALYLLEIKSENRDDALQYLDSFSKILLDEIESNTLLRETNRRLNLERTKRSISQDKLSEIELAKSNMELQMKLKESKLINQRQTIFYFSIFSGLFAVILVILFVLFRSKKKNNELLEEKNRKLESVNEILNLQNETIIEQTDRIMDSINYGLTIQKAMLPSQSGIDYLFPNNFVFYKPKDIVSGDFYWFQQINGMKFAAVIDCTGHGVPGAFMSMIGNTLLNEIVINDKITNPAQILHELDLKVRESLQNTENEDLNDGMDVCLIRVDAQGRVDFAGANRPLYVVSGEKWIEVKGDKYSIGGLRTDMKEFTRHGLGKLHNATIYLTTDGFADQNNSANKKYSTKQLKKMLYLLSNKVLEEQLILINDEFQRHIGYEKQRDDITIIGLRV